MTNHADLSRRLALAIGYAPEAAQIEESCETFVYGDWGDWAMPRWRRFDYQDPTVWGPVLEWLMREYDAIAQFLPGSKRFEIWRRGRGVYADTLAEAVAKAAIAVKGGE